MTKQIIKYVLVLAVLAVVASSCSSAKGSSSSGRGCPATKGFNL